MNNEYVQNIFNQCLEKLKQTHHYQQHHVDLLLAKLTIKFNDRLRTKAGNCRWTHVKELGSSHGVVLTVGVTFSTLFLSKTTTDQHYNLISHEFAHAYEVVQTGGKTDHGHRWQSIHRAMGGDAKQFHNVNVPKNKVKRHTLLNVLTGQVYNNVSTRMMHKCLRTNQILGKVKYEVKGYRTV